jgi:hypothetical protein
MSCRTGFGNMQQNGFTNGDIAGALGTVMQSGTFGGPWRRTLAALAGPAAVDPAVAQAVVAAALAVAAAVVEAADAAVVAAASAAAAVVAALAAPGGFRGQNPNAWHGTGRSYSGSDSAFNADSILRDSGTARSQAAVRERNALAASVTGTPYIPGWLTTPNPKQFVFLSRAG